VLLTFWLSLAENNDKAGDSIAAFEGRLPSKAAMH
jgi:hypothetical protein